MFLYCLRVSVLRLSVSVISCSSRRPSNSTVVLRSRGRALLALAAAAAAAAAVLLFVALLGCDITAFSPEGAAFWSAHVERAVRVASAGDLSARKTGTIVDPTEEDDLHFVKLLRPRP